MNYYQGHISLPGHKVRLLPSSPNHNNTHQDNSSPNESILMKSNLGSPMSHCIASHVDHSVVTSYCLLMTPDSKMLKITLCK